MGCIIVILDSVSRSRTSAPSGELPFLRGFFEFYTTSGTADLFRTQLIPGFFNVFGLLIPDDLQTLLRRARRAS